MPDPRRPVPRKSNPVAAIHPDMLRFYRVTQLWWLVLIGHVLTFGAVAAIVGPAAMAGHLLCAMAIAAAIVVDLAIVGLSYKSALLRRWMMSHPRRLKTVAAALSFTPAFFASYAVMAALSASPSENILLAATAIGILMVGAAATAMERLLLFAYAAGTGVGAALANGSLLFVVQTVAFLAIVALAVRQDRIFRRHDAKRSEANVSDQQRAQGLLNDFENAGLGWFWETDRQGALVYVSETFAATFGKAQPELIGQSFTQLFRSRLSEENSEARTLGFHLSSRNIFRDITVTAAVGGDERAWAISGRPISDAYGNFIGFRGSGTDLTEADLAEKEINKLARFDTLTGLANRLNITELLEKSLHNHLGRPQACALFMLDLDRFKAVNDTLGHPVGDQLLQQVAQRLRAIVGEVGHVGRLGGDEFQVVIPGSKAADELAKLADAIIARLGEPFLIERQRVQIGASVGIAVSDREDVSSTSMIRNADLALYAAKDAGRGVHRFFASAMQDLASERKDIEDALRGALSKQQMTLLYQPVVDVSSETINGFEALLRWNHPVKGAISPEKFIPIAEDANLIVPIGEWIIRSACEAIARFGPGYRVAVNVSPRQFSTETLPQLIVSAIAAAQISPSQLELEITEGVFLEESPDTIAMFQKLKRIGVRVALDDFGTGYSALGYLKKAAFDKIKIDQSFVRGAAERTSMNRAIINSIVGLANGLEMDTTAEGVETHDELAMVRELGCSHVQGYIYGRAMPLDDAVALLKAHGGKAIATGHRCAREPRRRILRTAVLESGGYEYEAVLRNLSSRGALVEGLCNVPENTPFTVHLSDTVAVQAVSRWCENNLVGVAFGTSIDVEKVLRSPVAKAQQRRYCDPPAARSAA